MKQAMVNNQEEAVMFVSSGGRNTQKAAYWAENGKAWRAERLPGMEPTVSCADSIWWSATETVRQRLGLDYGLSNPAATLGRKGGSAKSDAKAAASRENGKKGGRPRKANA